MGTKMRKFLVALGLTATVLLGLVVVSNAASISGQVTYTGVETGTLTVGAWTNSSFTGDALGYITVAIPPSAFPVNYVIQNVSDGTYYIQAFLDTNGDLQPGTGEPKGAFGMPDPIVISGGSSVSGKNFSLVAGGTTNTISGRISYTGTTPGRLRVEIFDNPTFTGTPVRFVINEGVMFPFDYNIGDLADGTYYVTAYLDSNYNNVLDGSTEPKGQYGSPDALAVSGGTTLTSKDFTLQDPGTGGGGGHGTTGSVLNMASDPANGYDFSAEAASAWAANADIIYLPYGGPTDLEVNNGNIKNLGMMDTAAFTALTTFDLTGATVNHLTPELNHVYIFNSKENKPVAIHVANINPTPAMISFGWKYDYVVSQGPPFTIKLAVGDSTTPTADAKVELYNTNGDWNPDNDVMVSSTTTSATYTTEGTNKYNAVLSVGTPTYLKSDGTPYNYSIYISKTGKRLEDRWINFSATMPSTLYTSWITGWDYITLRDAPVVSVTNLGIKVGDTTGTTGTISPDNNGVNDFCDIVFKYTVTGASDSWEKGGQAKICIDTNGNDIFEPFDHSKFFWDENGGPYYDKNDPDNWNWDAYQTAKTAGTLSQYRLSQQEFNAMQAGKDWSMDMWIDSWSLDANNSITQSIRWEGRDNTWNAVANGTYKVQIQVDNPNWFEGDGISFTDSTTLTVTIATAGISGTVKDDQGSGISGVRVNAGAPPPGGWGSAYTKADGTYVISGLGPGRYHVNTESGASGYPNQDYPSDVEVTEGNTTGGINFTLERGGQITGTITIPAPGFKKYRNPWYQGTDPNDPSYYIIDGWIEIQAWSPNSPQHGWGKANVQDDTDDTIAQTVNYTLNLPPGTYNVSARMEGYASETKKDISVTKGTPTTLNISLTKAGSISGTVSLPAGVTASEFLFVDISANSTDGKYFGWGGVSISSGTSSTDYLIRGLPNATYKVRYNIWGRYKPGESAAVVVSSDAKDVTGLNYTFDIGVKIKGKLNINGDTSGYQESGGGGGGGNNFYVWINCWSPESGYGTGTQVTATKGPAQEIDYEIGGLEAGKTYQVDSWLFGFEMANWPLNVSIPSGATEVTQDITLSPYVGSIGGVVTGSGIDYTKCRVTVREPWWGDWRAPKYSDLDADGGFNVTGLGTGEYIVTANEYYVKPSTSMPLGIPTGEFGTVTERIPLANGQSLTGVTLALSAGAKITGTISLSSNVYTINDLENKIVIAVPMRMQWMGWAVPYVGLVRVTGGVATYSIDGLSDDIYVVTPPVYIEQKTSQWGPPEADLAGEKQVVTVKSGGTTKNVNFSLTDGYSITGTLQRPVSGEEEYLHLSLQRAGGGWDEVAGAEVAFANWGPEKQDLDKRSLSFAFKHIAPNRTDENYIIRVFTPNYKVTNKEVTVVDKNVDVGTIIVTKGATIKGKLVDAETGQSLSMDNGLEVICEARPWVEGGWRSSNEWLGSSGSSAWEEQGGMKTGVFRLRNLPAGTYIVRISASGVGKGQSKTSSTTKNYVSTYLAGVVVPDSTEEVDIGTIKLRGGVTISGKVTDKNGTALPNVWMAAMPSAVKGESVTCKATTDAGGNYVIEGIDPLIGYWDVTAAARPWWGEGIRVRYGEVTKNNVAPRATGVNFELEAATANLSGKVLAPEGLELAIPFPGEEMPVAYLLLQNQAIAYTEPMAGIEQITWPDGSFTIQGIVPGTYTLKVFSKGSATSITRNIAIVAGDNSIGDIQLVKGGTVAGTIKTTEGKNINTSMFELPVAMRADFSSMVFGTFNSNQVTKEIEGYSIQGLAPGIAYYVVLAAEEGADIFVSTPTVTVSSASETKTHNITYQDLPPNFLVAIYKNEEGKFVIGAWATETLKEDDPADVISLKNTTAGDGISEGTLGDLIMSPNRQEITAIYTPDASDTQCTITIGGHDLAGQAATTKDYTFGLGVDTYNLTVFNPMLGGTLEVGQGDATEMQIPGGAIESTENIDGSMTKVQTVGAAVNIAGAPLSLAAYPPQFVQADRAPKPAQGNKVSPYYEVNIGTSQIGEDKTAKVTLQYTASSVSDPTKIDIYSFDGTKWVAEIDGRTVDEANYSISADVNHTSLFAVFETEGTAPTAYTGDFKAYMYPSPFKPETHTTAYFRVKLPATLGTENKIKIQIYNIAGELVRELEKTMDGGTQDTVDWDGKNDSGSAVASGVYIYRLTLNDEEKQIEKIAVIK